jgi:regulator of cell morphogenesis and NO signaling
MNMHVILAAGEDTPLSERTIGALVAERPGRSRIFQALNIDFCCKGGRTLRAACEQRDIPLAAILEELAAEAAGRPEPQSNPAELPPAELAAYIVETHHAYLRRELPRLHAMAERVAQVHGERMPALVEVLEVFHGLFLELDSHIRKEEQILFPAIAAASAGEAASWAFDDPVARMLEEHDDAGEALARLRELTNGYQPPADACNTWRALFAGLEELETDLHRHIHLENHVLFPAALALNPVA